MARQTSTPVERKPVEAAEAVPEQCDQVHQNQADHLPTIDPETGKPTTYGELRNPTPVEEDEQDSEPLQGE